MNTVTAFDGRPGIDLAERKGVLVAWHPSSAMIMCPQEPRQRTSGFRFSAVDAGALVVLSGIAFGLQRLGSSLAWLIVLVAAHFFLFCNLFRVARRRELLWAAIFILNVAFWLILGRLEWFNVMSCQLPVSAGVIAWELKATRYHGIFAKRLNPSLEDYLAGRIS